VAAGSPTTAAQGPMALPSHIGHHTIPRVRTCGSPARSKLDQGPGRGKTTGFTTRSRQSGRPKRAGLHRRQESRLETVSTGGNRWRAPPAVFASSSGRKPASSQQGSINATSPIVTDHCQRSRCSAADGACNGGPCLASKKSLSPTCDTSRPAGGCWSILRPLAL